MTSYRDILEASESAESDEAVRRIKKLAAETLHDADPDMRLMATEHFNHSYLPDFVMRWPNRPSRSVFLRASSYADEIKDDVVRLADRDPIFVQLSEFVPLDDRPLRESIDSLSESAAERKSLVASMPAIGLLDDSPRTGKLLSSFVMRGGKGVIEDSEVGTLGATVESGFNGAINADRPATASALLAVDNILVPSASAEFTHLFEAAWISSGALATDFPGGVISIGDVLSADMLRQMLDIVPESLNDFWEKIGNAITLDSFSGLHLVGSQPRLQSIMQRAVKRLASNRCIVRQTQRADQETDPFLWQIEDGSLSLRGGGYQCWVGPISRSSTDGVAFESEVAIDGPPSLSKLASRSEDAGLTISEISVSDADGIVVRFSSPGDSDIATSDLVERVAEGVGNAVKVSKVVARIGGKSVPVDYATAAASLRTNSRVSVSGLIWTGWNLLAETGEQVREDLASMLGFTDDDPTSGEVSAIEAYDDSAAASEESSHD